MSTPVYGTRTPTPTTLHHGPTLRDDIGSDDDFGIIDGGDDYSSEENEENGSLIDDSNIGFGSPDMYRVEDLLEIGKLKKKRENGRRRNYE